MRAMKTIKLARVLREGVRNFYRDKWLTLATVVIMSLALYLIGIGLLLGYGVMHAIDAVEDRINISVYFDLTVPAEEIEDIKKTLEDKRIQQIASIRYVSREQAMQDFMAREGDSKEIQEALKIANENPLPASLVITAYDAASYEDINTYMHQEYGDRIMNTSFDRNKKVVQDIQKVIIFVRNIGLALGVIFVVIAVLVTLNTVRMSLYAHRAEFDVMRLVGASHLYVKVPTLVEGILYGAASALIAILALVATVYGVDPFAQRILTGVDLSAMYGGVLVIMMGSVLLLGVFLGFVSSAIGIRRYLER